MRHAWLLALTILAADPRPALAADNPPAILRCDPALFVKAIDGDKKKRVSPADTSEDCNVSLTPGRHSLEVSFEWSHSAALVEMSWSSHEDASVDFEAVAGRIYRLKGTLIPSWKAWVEDVTTEESVLRDLLPAPKQKSKTRNSAVVVARLAPRDVVVVGYQGGTKGPWLWASKFLGLYIKKEAQGSTDLAFAEVDDGTSFGVTSAVTNGNAFSLNKNRGDVCGETRVPVFEKLTGGKVYYLGSFDYAVVPTGLEFTLTQKDMESVRQQLRADRPELADALEPATFRMSRVRRPCEAVKSGELWINRNIEGASADTPASASAGSM
jgi:hypothetical protein